MVTGITTLDYIIGFRLSSFFFEIYLYYRRIGQLVVTQLANAYSIMFDAIKVDSIISLFIFYITDYQYIQIKVKLSTFLAIINLIRLLITILK